MVYKQNFELGFPLKIIIENIISKHQFKRWLLLRFILWCLWERIDTKCSSEL